MHKSNIFTFFLAAVAIFGITTAVLAARGGPDTYGYTYKDYIEDDGPAYAWEEISDSGTLIPVEDWTDFDDGYAGPIPIGFDFNYYGTVYDEVFVSTNGYVTFGEGDGTMPYPPHPLPHPQAPNNDIGLYGWDLELNDYGNYSTVYYQTLNDPTRLVIEFVNICRHSCSYLYTFEVILYADGDIKTQYGYVDAESDYVGIENADGSDGLNYRHGPGNHGVVQYYYPQGVLIKPFSQEGFDQPGRLHRYKLNLMNRSGMPDRYDLSVLAGNSYTVTLSITQTEVIEHGENHEFTAWVELPASASPTDFDEAVILVSSVTSPTVISDTTVLHTTAIGGELAYIAHYSTKAISLVDTGTNALVKILDVGNACNGPIRMSIPPQGEVLYVICDESRSLMLIDIQGNYPLVNIPLIYATTEAVFTKDGAFALIGIYYGDILVINTTTLEQVTVIHATGPVNNLAAHPYDNLAYAAMEDQGIAVIDTTSFTIVDTIPVDYPKDVLTSPDGNWLYASSEYFSPGLFIIDTDTNAIYTHVPLNGSPRSIAITPDGAKIFVNNYVQVDVIDGDTFTYQVSIHSFDLPIQSAMTCDGSKLYVTNDSYYVSVVDTLTYAVSQISLPYEKPFGVVICPHHVLDGIQLVPQTQSGYGVRDEIVTYHETLANYSDEEHVFALELGGHAWTSTLSVDSLGPLAAGESASFTISVTVPGDANWLDSDALVITATAVSSPMLFETATITTLADAPPQFDLQPLELASVQMEGSSVTQTLAISNPGFAPVGIAFYEFSLSGDQLIKATEELDGVNILEGARILYDRSHGEPSLLQFSLLVDDLYAAGAEIDENYTQIGPEVLEGYDILWVNCCGSLWTFAELTAVNEWLSAGGAVLVQGEFDYVTSGVASIYDITYQEYVPFCPLGITTNIIRHPITNGMEAIWVNSTCYGLVPGPYGQEVVYDFYDGVHTVAVEHDGGKMVVVAADDFINQVIGNADNRTFANNIFTWLSLPIYNDVPWLDETPRAFTLPGYSNQGVTVTLDASTLAPGIYTAVLAIEHNDLGKPLPVQVPVTLTVITQGAGVALTPTAQEANAPPGETVAYTITLTNLGNITDSFTLEVSSTWTTTLSAETSPLLGSGQSFTFNLSVTTPISATDGIWDVALITATSDYDGSVSATAQATTTVAIPPEQWFVFIPVVRRE